MARRSHSPDGPFGRKALDPQTASFSQSSRSLHAQFRLEAAVTVAGSSYRTLCRKDRELSGSTMDPRPNANHGGQQLAIARDPKAGRAPGRRELAACRASAPQLASPQALPGGATEP